MSGPVGGTVTGIAGSAFADMLRIKAGQMVTWTNNDPVPHTASSDDGKWDSGDVAAGRSFSRRFDLPGTYAYHCNNHPAMQGTVVVSSL
jgi:plastocyanin